MSLSSFFSSLFSPLRGSSVTSPGAVRVLKGDGTWPFTAEVDGEDIVVRDVYATCFGGSNDPQDNGDTASGISTKKNPTLAACSLPLDTASVPVLRGSPLPHGIPWKTMVEVTDGVRTITVPLIDLGPGKQASKPGKPHAIDLTRAAALKFDAMATATNFMRKVSFRIKGAARFIPSK